MGGEGSGRKVRTPWIPARGTKSWDRQPLETDQAWKAFVAYRDLPAKRSVKLAIEVLGKKPNYSSTMEQWSLSHHWRIRTAAWDSCQDKMHTEAILKARKKAATDMVERHLNISTHLQRLTSVEILRWIRKIDADSEKPDLNKAPVLNPQQIHTLLNYAIKLERLNRGEPESITEERRIQEEEYELEKLSDEDLLKYRDILSKMQK